jgi:hypothetical protein
MTVMVVASEGGAYMQSSLFPTIYHTPARSPYAAANKCYRSAQVYVRTQGGNAARARRGREEVMVSFPWFLSDLSDEDESGNL